MKTPHHTPRSGRSQNSLSVLPSQPMLNSGVRAVWLAGVGCWALIAVPALVTAAPAQKTAGKGTVQVKVSAKMQDRSSRGATYNLPMGRTLQFQPPKGFQFRVEEGAESVQLTAADGLLAVKPQRLGRATIVVDAPNAPTQTYLVRVVDAAPGEAVAAPAVATPAAAAEPAAPAEPATPAEPAAPAAVAGDAAGAQAVLNAQAGPQSPAAADASAAVAAPAVDAAAAQNLLNAQAGPQTPAAADAAPAAAAPAAPGVPASNLVPAPVSAPSLPTNTDTAQLSPAVRTPARLPVGKEPFPTRSQLPRLVANQQAAAARNTINVSQGLARLLRFNTNILAVFYSDVSVMDARAVNARTVALTGLGPGTSTLAVFSERFPGDAVGKANIYQISVRPQGAGNIKTPAADPESLATAIRAALGDSRVNVSVIQTPDGNLAARLTGILRDQSEIDAAKTTTALFVPQVISSLYADKASAIPGVSSGEAQLQATLRQISGNDTIELISLPNGLTLKAVVGSQAEAQRILSLIPLATSQKVMPFIVVRGASGGDDAYTGSNLSPEDQDMTKRLSDVTGISTVYAVRTAENGVAIYGTVRNRRELETLRRYSIVLPQLVKGTAPAGGAGSSVNLPSAGNAQSPGIQFFVRVLDEADSTVRMVTAETSIVEINRNDLKNLGIQYGSVQVTNETGAGVRTIDNTFRPGEITAGDGFAGGGRRGLIDPVRLRINALYENGNARILSNPSIQAVEGASAQITIGGARPIPQVLSVGGGNSTALQNVIFRKYGIILTMRPTISDDDTIILQIRADVTSLDATTSVVINGALIPGETVRSVDTTLTVKEGDTIIMGGLMTNDRSVRTSRLPVLSEIPIIGSLFKSKRFENNQTELAIFMTPRISRVPISPNGQADVTRVPSLPELPGIQQQNTIFANSTGGNQ